MAILNHFTTACRRSFGGDRLNQQLVFVLRALHKSAAGEVFGMSAAGDGAMPERLIAPAGEKSTVKTLKEMPGPGVLSNLIEFFWRDGFSRVHEIQVRITAPCVLCVSQMCHLCVKWHRPLRKGARGAWPLVKLSAPKV